MKNIKQIWLDRANMNISDDEILRKVIDPNDLKGIKNNYIDEYLKYYLLDSLKPKDTDCILDIGCGYGRLTDFIAPRVHQITGVDITPEFIRYAENNKKAENVLYFLPETLRKQKNTYNKAFIVWVLLCIESDEDLKRMLEFYFDIGIEELIIIDQFKDKQEIEFLEGSFYAKYRKQDDIIKTIEELGFELVRKVGMGERNIGPVSRLLFNGRMYKILPRYLNKISKYLFWLDFAITKIFFIKKLQFTSWPLDACLTFRRCN